MWFLRGSLTSIELSEILGDSWRFFDICETFLKILEGPPKFSIVNDGLHHLKLLLMFAHDFVYSWGLWYHFCCCFALWMLLRSDCICNSVTVTWLMGRWDPWGCSGILWPWWDEQCQWAAPPAVKQMPRCWLLFVFVFTGWNSIFFCLVFVLFLLPLFVVDILFTFAGVMLIPTRFYWSFDKKRLSCCFNSFGSFILNAAEIFQRWIYSDFFFKSWLRD